MTTFTTNTKSSEDLFVYPDNSFVFREDYIEGDGDDFQILYFDTPEYNAFVDKFVG